MGDSNPSDETFTSEICPSPDGALEPLANNDTGEYLFPNTFACNCKTHLNNVHLSRDKCSKNVEMVKRFEVAPANVNDLERVADHTEDCLDRINRAVPVSVKDEVATIHRKNGSLPNKADSDSPPKSTTYDGNKPTAGWDPRLNSFEWWNDDLTALRTQCVRKRRLLHRKKDEPEIRAAKVTEYQIARRLYNQELKRNRKKYEAEMALLNLMSDVNRLRLLNWDEWY